MRKFVDICTNKYLFVTIALLLYGFNDLFYAIGLSNVRSVLYLLKSFYGIGLGIYYAYKYCLYKDKRVLLELGFIGICFISSFINNIYLNNVRYMLFLISDFLVMFILFVKGDKDKDRTFFLKIAKLFVVITFAATLLSLVFFVTKHLGFNAYYPGRFYGLYDMPSEAGCYTLQSIIFSLMLLDNHCFSKVFNYVNITIQIILFMMSQSRTSYLILICLLFTVFTYHIGKNKKLLGIIFISMVLSLGVTLGISLVADQLNKVAIEYRNAEVSHYVRDYDAKQLADIIQSTAQKSSIAYEVSADDVKLVGKDKFFKDLTSNKWFVLLDRIASKRLSIWMSAVYAWTDKPVLGYGYKNSSITLHLYDGFSNAHSLFFNLLFWVGSVGTLYYLGCLGYLLKPCLRIKAIIKNKDLFLWFTAIGILIHGLLEFGVIGDTQVITPLFWCLLGYLNNVYSGDTL